MRSPIRVLVADDSRTARLAIVAALRGDPALDVIAEAGDSREAIDCAQRLRPDVITMDILMPPFDGIEAIRGIMASAPARIVVVSSAVGQGDLAVPFRALAAGALEVLPKPVGCELRELVVWSNQLRESITLMAGVPVVRRSSPAMVDRAAAGRTPAPIARDTRLAAFAFGASTGGPKALARILGELPSGLPVPVLVAQHTTPGFARGLARWLDEAGAMRVRVVDRPLVAMPSVVYLPADGQDLYVTVDGNVQVEPARSGSCPSVNRLFESVAAAYGRRAGAALLTGMGDDGAKGLLAVRRAGGVTVCQDESTSVVFGMPKAGLGMGAAQHVLPLDAIARAVAALCSATAARRPGESSC